LHCTKYEWDSSQHNTSKSRTYCPHYGDEKKTKINILLECSRQTTQLWKDFGSQPRPRGHRTISFWLIIGHALDMSLLGLQKKFETQFRALSPILVYYWTRTCARKNRHLMETSPVATICVLTKIYWYHYSISSSWQHTKRAFGTARNSTLKASITDFQYVSNIR